MRGPCTSTTSSGLELVIRGPVIYAILFLRLRASGNRQFSSLTSFDLVVLLLIAETASQALVGDDHSLTAAIIVIMTIVLIDIGISLVKRGWKRVDDYLEGLPVILVDEGRLVAGALRKECVDGDDILEAARITQGIEDLAGVKYAILERNGDLSIIGRDPAARRKE